jgi:hypothetical protein
MKGHRLTTASPFPIVRQRRAVRMAARSNSPRKGEPMYVWSKRLAIGLLMTFTILLGLFFFEGHADEASALKIHTTRWIILNYIGLLVWIFVWMIDQARVRGKNVMLWLVPYLFAPLPTLLLFILALQRRMKS